MAAETINMRTTSDRKRKLQIAADLTDRNLTAFVLAAAEDAADQVIANHQSTVMAADFFDDFFDAVAAEPAPALVDAAKRLPGLIRRG